MLKLGPVRILVGLLILCSCNGESSQENVVLRVPVTIEEVGKGDIASFISLTGTLLPVEEMKITSEIGGEINFSTYESAPVSKGDAVKKGQLFATLVNENHELTVRIESKKLAMDNAKKDFEEKEKLSKSGGIPPNEVEVARRNMLDAELNYKAGLLELEKMNIRIPMNGILAEKAPLFQGQMISPNTEIGKVMRYDQVTCELSITNDDIGKVRLGQEVIITNFAYEDELFTGIISKISPTIDPQTRTFQIEVMISNADFKLRPGMFVKADIVVDKRLDVIKIPKYSIVQRSNRDVVFVVENQVAKLKEVVVGIKDSEFAEIIEGLAEKDRLVIRGYETLKDNTKVRASR